MLLLPRLPRQRMVKSKTKRKTCRQQLWRMVSRNNQRNGKKFLCPRWTPDRVKKETKTSQPRQRMMSSGIQESIQGGMIQKHRPKKKTMIVMMMISRPSWENRRSSPGSSILSCRGSRDSSLFQISRTSWRIRRKIFCVTSVNATLFHFPSIHPIIHSFFHRDVDSLFSFRLL